MSKEASSISNNPINLPRRLREGLEEADGLLIQGKPQQALTLLHELEMKYPHQADVLALMVNAYLDMGNQHGYLHTIHQLHELTPNQTDVKLGLAGAYLSNGHLALALQTFHQFLKRWPHDDRVTDVQETILQLQEELAEILKGFGDSLETGYEFACQHEELRFFMEMGNYTRCRTLAKKLLQQRPSSVPVLNNLSLVEWLEGNLPQAIETSLKVLEIEPWNVHALSNLTRFLYYRGERKESMEYAQQLKDSDAEATDRWVKKAEALSFIGDDDGVLELLDQARRTGKLDELNELVWHWCAVAEYRKGNITGARKHWQKCLKLAPYFSLASGNLSELKKPQHERICPQAFSLETWIPRKTLESLTSTTKRAARKKDDGVFRARLAGYFEQNPELISFVPEALANGDEQCREFALKLADMSAHPVILDSLKKFSLGQEGPDTYRLEASQILSKHGIFKTGNTIELSLEGERRPIMMLGFQITYDALKQSKLKPAAQHLMGQAIYALRDKDGVKAEIHLRKALEIQKNEPSLLNNLALAMSLQGKLDDASAIAREISDRFPDYFFGQAISVRNAIKENELEKAKAILNKMMQKEELHVTEFGALCACQIDLMIVDDKPEGAVAWFEIWEKGFPDDPALEDYEQKVAIIKAFTKLTTVIPRSGRKARKRLN